MVAESAPRAWEIPFIDRIMRIGVLLAMLLALLSVRAAPRRCPTRKIAFKITQEDIARQEHAEAEGHQPWRSNPKAVADVALMDVEKGLDPSRVDSIPFKQISKSEMQIVYMYELADRHRSERVTVKRFHSRDPEIGKTWTTVWGATEVLVTDCSEEKAAPEK